MGAANPHSVLERATVEEAREELSKFFTVAMMADEAPGMFSAFIDAEWHRLMETPDYPDFCMRSVGQHVGHAPSLDGEGEIPWIDVYHQLFGALPGAWFADETGVVDTDSMATYLDTQTVRASWNCSPTSGDPDKHNHTK
jgi:hypothetical protein